MIAPAYTRLDTPRPPTLNLPKARLQKSPSVDHDGFVKKLQQFQLAFADRKPFWTDVAVLDRLHYKNTNQHRHFHRFRRTMELRRILKRFKALAIDQTLGDLYRALWNAKTLKQCEGAWHHVPSKEHCEYTMHRLVAAALLLDRCQVILIEVYRDHTTLLRLEHFVSLALVYMGLCSRLYSLAHLWSKQIEDCYDLLQAWHEALPSGLGDTQRAAYLEASNQRCTPAMLKKARKKYAAQMRCQLRSKQEPTNIASYIAHEHLISSQGTSAETKSTTTTPKAAEKGPDEDDLGQAVDRGSMMDEDLGESIDRASF